MVIEVPAKDPQPVSDIKRHHVHVLELETVLMTIYYPAEVGSGSGEAPGDSKTWRRETWLPRPRLSTAYGYGQFARIGPLAVPILAGSTMFCKLPAFRNARLAKHWPPSESSVADGAKVKGESGPAPEGAPKEPKFPVLIFSHGLGGSRTMYSSLCGEFASYGFVVCAVEHRDGSGPRSFVNYPPEGFGSIEEREASGNVEHLPRDRKKGYSKIDYIFPKGNPFDTSPNNDKGVDRELRDAQVALRSLEILEAYHVLCDIGNGNGSRVMKQNLRKKGYVGSSSGGLDGIEWDDWRDRIDLDSVTMVGHSFGAATTINVLREQDKFPFLKAGIIYDIWAAGIRIPPPGEEEQLRIRVPLLAINSEAFTYWQKNYNLVQQLVEEVEAQGYPAWLMTVRGTIHLNQSDMSILYPKICSLALKMTVHPERALDLNINASLEFLRLALPNKLAAVTRSMLQEGLLESEIQDIEQISEDELHKPTQQWLAARLNIPNELSYRLSPKERARRKAAHKAAKARIAAGKALPEEIWMHVKPSKELVKGFECYHCNVLKHECECTNDITRED